MVDFGSVDGGAEELRECLANYDLCVVTAEGFIANFTLKISVLVF